MDRHQIYGRWPNGAPKKLGVLFFFDGRENKAIDKMRPIYVGVPFFSKMANKVEWRQSTYTPPPRLPRNSRFLFQSFENPLLSLNKAGNETLISEGDTFGVGGRLTRDTIPPSEILLTTLICYMEKWI